MKYFFVLCCSILLFACQQKADSEKVKQFAIQMHAATTGTIKATQQSFVDKMTETLKAVQQDPAIIVDTKTLRELLENAKAANHTSFVEVSKITEVDNTINLREKALAEIELFRGLYEHEMTGIVDILESNAPDKKLALNSLIAAFSAKEGAITTTQNTAKDAGYVFDKKYDINFPKDTNDPAEKVVVPKKMQ